MGEKFSSRSAVQIISYGQVELRRRVLETIEIIEGISLISRIGKIGDFHVDYYGPVCLETKWTS